MKLLQGKRYRKEPFGPREFLIWLQWYVVAVVLGVCNLPVILVNSLPKILRYNHMFLVFWSTLVLDLGLKEYFSILLKNGRVIEIIPGLFSLTLVHNKGAAFGVMQGQGSFFVFIAALTGILILFYLAVYRDEDPRVCWGLILILSGAIGNMYDRLYHGHVVDYLLVYYRDYKWPVFNLADILINVGVGILALDILLEFRRKGK